MDLMTLLGMVGGAALLGWGMLSTAGGDIMPFVDYPSVAITVGGALSATTISCSLDEIKSFFKVGKVAFKTDATSAVDLIRTLVSFGEIARRDGILALEGALEGIKDDFLIRGIQMAVDGSDPDLINNTMNTELEQIAGRHSGGTKVYDLLTKYAPAFGMIGTLIGLVVLLKNLDDPDLIGPSMAVALITTLYGAVMANLITGTISDKLKGKHGEEAMLKQIIISGVMSIQSGDNPKIVEQKLRIYLAPGDRAKLRG